MLSNENNVKTVFWPRAADVNVSVVSDLILITSLSPHPPEPSYSSRKIQVALALHGKVWILICCVFTEVNHRLVTAKLSSLLETKIPPPAKKPQLYYTVVIFSPFIF